MARLYPPNIAGVLPAFYKKTEEGAAYLTVPFSMNKTVKSVDIKEFSLRIKTANTDILLGVLPSYDWTVEDLNNPKVRFAIPNEVLYKLVIGQFYKIQIAYVNRLGEIGYYSSVGIMKCTSRPEISISDCYIDTININRTEYIGIYKNEEDPTERAYQYQFNFYTNENILIESSGWKFHNSYEDSSVAESIDRYTLKSALQGGKIYRIEYQVITVNNLLVSSPRYLLIESDLIEPEAKITLNAELDYENACINLSLISQNYISRLEEEITGSFLLSRSSSLDNYSTWLPISKIHMTGEKPSSFLLKDYTIVQGATYLYCIQQYNEHDIYSNRILSEKVEAQFEDMFLFDGERQLKIKFNPKVTSFKTILQESKKITLGSKYPFITKNGIVAYKEFPVSGLISYFIDDNELFVNKANDLYVKNWKKTTDIVDDNILLERLFKIKVLDWLNDGKPKLFKSPQEGNYIVRIMNTTLTPIEPVSRMLHSFSCQAVEIADYTSENLIKYKLLNVEDIPLYQTRWETISLQNMLLTKKQKIAELESQRELLGDAVCDLKISKVKEKYEIFNTDLLQGKSAYSLKISEMTLGSIFQFINSEGQIQQIMIGATGSYEAVFEEPITKLQLLKKNASESNSIYDPESSRSLLSLGFITYSIRSTSQNQFDTITKIVTQSVPSMQVYGPANNIFTEYDNIKTKLIRMNFVRFTKLDVQEIYSPLFGLPLQLKNNNSEIINPNTQINGYKDGDVFLNGVIQELSEDQTYDIQTLDYKNEIVHTYYRFYDGKLYALPHFSTQMPPNPIALNQYTVYSFVKLNDNKEEIISYYRLVNNQLVIDTWIKELIDATSGQYAIQYHDLNQYTVYLKKYYDNNNQLKEQYFKYNGVTLELLDNYSTLINYNGQILDVNEVNSIEYTKIEQVPNNVEIGSGIMAEFGFQYKITTYNVEEEADIQEEKETYENLRTVYNAAALDLKLVLPISTTITEDGQEKQVNVLPLQTDNLYYIWDQYDFRQLLEDEIELYKTPEYADEMVYELNMSDTRLMNYEQLQKLKNNYKIAENMYFTKIEEMLRAQQEGLYE